MRPRGCDHLNWVKVESNNTSYDEIMWKHGIGTINENGEMFATISAKTTQPLAELFFHTSHVTWLHWSHMKEEQKIRLTTSVLQDGLEEACKM